MITRWRHRTAPLTAPRKEGTGSDQTFLILRQQFVREKKKECKEERALEPGNAGLFTLYIYGLGRRDVDTSQTKQLTPILSNKLIWSYNEVFHATCFVTNFNLVYVLRAYIGLQKGIGFICYASVKQDIPSIVLSIPDIDKVLFITQTSNNRFTIFRIRLASACDLAAATSCMTHQLI